MIKVLRMCTVGVLLWGCEDADTTPGVSDTRPIVQQDVSDSAGVRIVDHAFGDPSRPDAKIVPLDINANFVVDSVPRPESSELHRVTGAAFLSDGRFVVGHGSLNELLLFDPKRGFVRSMGGQGSGPTEFRSITGIWSLDNGEIAVYDESQRRVTVLDTLARPVRVTVLSGRIAQDTLYRLWKTFGVSPSGIALLWMDRNDGTTSGMSRPNMQLATADIAGRLTAVGVERPGLERYVMPPRKDGGFSYGRSPIARSPIAIMCGEMIAVADNGSYELVIAPTTFSTQTIVRVPVRARVAEDRDYIDAIRLQFGAEFEVTDDMIAPARMMTPSGLLPVIHALHCDEQYHVWVEESAIAPGQGSRLAAYRADGTILRSLLLPPGLRVLAVSTHAIVVLRLDEDGNEFVQVHAIPSP